MPTSEPATHFTREDLEDLSIALELRIIHYWEEFDAVPTYLGPADGAIAYQHVADLVALLNKLRLALGLPLLPPPPPYASRPTLRRHPSPAARRGPAWDDTTDEIDPTTRQTWRG